VDIDYGVALSSHFSGALAEWPKATAPLTEREHLLGDWGGARTALAAHSSIVGFDLTQFYQGVVSGSTSTSDWQYGVKGDLTLTLIGEKLGLWKGLIVNTHLEARGFKDIVGPLLSIEDTNGTEAYYKVQATPWSAITGDVQVITETLSTEKTKVVTGLCAKVTFCGQHRNRCRPTFVPRNSALVITNV